MFVRGQVYERKEIHEMYGGQKHGIISTPQKQSFVLIFTDDSVEGDGFNENGEYLLTGEGKTGDMKFVRGNKAIRDHVKDSKKLYLFKLSDKQGFFEFVSEAIYKDFETKKGPDKDGNERECIVFKLTLVEENKEDSKVEGNNESPKEEVIEAIKEQIEKKIEENLQQESEIKTEKEEDEFNKAEEIQESEEIQEQVVEKKTNSFKVKISSFFNKFKKK